MEAIIKLNNIPFDKQVISRSILEYADNDDLDINVLTEEQLRAFEDCIMDTPVFDEFNYALSCYLAEVVGEKYGEEYGDAFHGLPDNGDGIWFAGIEVDVDLFYEIRDMCHDLANDTDWLNKTLPEFIFVSAFS